MKRSTILALLLIVGGARVFAQSGSIETADEAGNSAADLKAISKSSERIAHKNVLKHPFFPPSKRDYAAIAPNDADVTKYAEFLKTPNTGLFRLHDAANCVSARNVVNVEDACPSGFILGKATAFSFRTKKYRTANFSDLLLRDKAFHAVGLNSQGVLTALGDVALENLTVSSDGVKSLAEFVPAINAAQAVRQAENFVKGVRAGKYVYRRSLRLKLNETYALRAVAYKNKILQRRGAFKVNILDDDKRDDVLTVFRVVRLNEDGSANLLWREIRREPAPKLVFETSTPSKN